MPLKDKITPEKVKQALAPRTPLWKGPGEDGVTFSLLSRFLCCRERFRCLVVEGLKPRDTFSGRMEFGSMWHACEEALAVGEYGGLSNSLWPSALDSYRDELRQKYPLSGDEINHWYSFTKALFPLYVGHWREHPDVVNRTPLLQEQVFNVPYRLPSGRIVRLRGKWDSVDLIGKGKETGIYLQENKTKSQIDGQKISRQLRFDLQTMLYLVALDVYEWEKGADVRNLKLRGVRYNVVRRSAHKSVESMLKKFHEDRDNGRIGEWFARWKVEITPKDIERFRKRSLDPVLEQLCDWWEWITTRDQTEGDINRARREVYGRSMHWQHPFGVWNVLDEGGSSDLDEYLESGSTAGLQRTDNLFPELT